MEVNQIEALELELLLEAIWRRYGYDFRHYARASLRRRVDSARRELGSLSISHLQARLLYSEEAFEQFLRSMSVTVTELFRDPDFYAAFRQQVMPLLSTYPFIKIWHAGCATGEEAYSMAIMLHEEGLLPRCQLFATDYNNQSLETAREATYPLERMSSYTRNYIEAGGRHSFADYYNAHYDFAKLAPFLSENITFAHHNLVADQVFGEMHVIICRNVLIYFDQDLQDRTLGLFYESLCPLGVFCLGSKESLLRSSVQGRFESLDKKQRIFRRIN
ncbi:MAG: chemotaxis protein methyltransferase CheR [Motiliproteus sp.]|jgi:chemotaxis protein methyltransferase CheR